MFTLPKESLYREASTESILLRIEYAWQPAQLKAIVETRKHVNLFISASKAVNRQPRGGLTWMERRQPVNGQGHSWK